MFGRMGLKCDYLQVLNTIIHALTVDVVNLLMGLQFATKVQFHQVSVFRNLVAIKGYLFVAAVDSPLSILTPVHGGSRPVSMEPLVVLRAEALAKARAFAASSLTNCPHTHHYSSWTTDCQRSGIVID